MKQIKYSASANFVIWQISQCNRTITKSIEYSHVRSLLIYTHNKKISIPPIQSNFVKFSQLFFHGNEKYLLESLKKGRAPRILNEFQWNCAYFRRWFKIFSEYQKNKFTHRHCCMKKEFLFMKRQWQSL